LTYFNFWNQTKNSWDDQKEPFSRNSILSAERISGAERLVGLHGGQSLGNFHDLNDLGTKYLNQVILAIEIETETLALPTARARFRATKLFSQFYSSD
jgi:hypothetical protein